MHDTILIISRLSCNIQAGKGSNTYNKNVQPLLDVRLTRFPSTENFELPSSCSHKPN